MTKANIIKSLLVVSLLGSLFLGISQASALGLKDAFNTDSGSSELKRFASFSGYDAEQPQSLEYYIGTALKSLFSILGIIFIALLMYSGFTWMTARGNESKVEKAKENIINVIIGLILIIGGYALTTFLLNIFT